MKGQESIAAIIVIIMTLVGIGALLYSNELVLSVANNNTGDYRTILDAETRADYYPYVVRKELNYTSNNVATEPVEWSSNIPNISEAREYYRREVQRRVKRQAKLITCDSPTISSVSLEGTSNLTAVLGDREITCETENTRTSIPVDSDADLSVENVKNRYVEALSYSSNYTRNLEENLDEFEGFSPSKNASSSTCDGETLQDAKDEARSSAISAVRSDIDDRVEDEKSDGDERESDWISIDIGGVEISGSCSYTTSSDYDEEQCYDPCESRDENGTCQGGYGDPGTDYEAKCELDTDEAEISFSIKDEEYKIITADGEINPVFPWIYTYYN